MKVVLDTNTLVSALLFSGVASRLLPFWQSRRILLAVSGPILEEYARVLAYPKFRLEEGEVRDLLEQEVLPFVTPVRVRRHLAVCRDAHDDKFIECALAARARYLVSGDSDLRELRLRSNLQVLSASELLTWLEQPVAKHHGRRRRRRPRGA